MASPCHLRQQTLSHPQPPLSRRSAASECSSHAPPCGTGVEEGFVPIEKPGIIGTRVSADDVDLAVGGGVSRALQLGHDVDRWDRDELEVGVAVDGEPVVVGSDVEVEEGLGEVAVGPVGEEVWGGDGGPEGLRDRLEDRVVLSGKACQNVERDCVREGRDEMLYVRLRRLFRGGHW
ncbi:hypothetical protein TIFTF001_004187 [Ficus carica]|uniref:Uncharacterized protein n=1 Tax=Ficus carica TaxID=3494 RepID=A0AA87ZWV7_FICCA|nr:hypothetical protein TIFTF001_004187 [Ficus carica]